jgi:hypothetical protein
MVTVKAVAGADMDTYAVMVTVTDVVEDTGLPSNIAKFDTSRDGAIQENEVARAIIDYIREPGTTPEADIARLIIHFIMNSGG